MIILAAALLFICLGGVDIARGYPDEDPCNNYQELSDSDRAVGFSLLTFKSDKTKSWKNGWHRFVGNAGDRMANWDSDASGCLEPPSCGAKYPGYLTGPHPDYLGPGQSVKGTVCFSSDKNCCYKTREVEIMKCQDFWIYKLPPPRTRRARYCGNGGKKPQCDEEKLLYGLSERYPARSCKDIKDKRKDVQTGVYWVDPDRNHPAQVFCDQETDGGGWTLVYSYTFTNYRGFQSGSNAITPRPNWPTAGNIVQSTTPPTSETDYNAMDFSQWENLGHEFMVKSNINHWIACTEGTGSLIKFRAGSLNCRLIKNIAHVCHGRIPDKLIFHTAGNPGSSLGPDLVRSQSTTWLKEYYYFEGSTQTGNWPTHDPCGENKQNHLRGVPNPHGNIYIRG